MFGDGRGAAAVVDGVSKNFGNGNVVDRISFSVNRGASFGLLGPNGAGKTTILKMMYGFFHPTSGRIEIEGHDVTRKARVVKRLLGIAPQDEVFDQDLTVSENLFFHARYFGFSRSRSHRLAGNLLEMMGLDGHRDDRVSHLSSGMRRRLLLSRAHLNDPSMIILDEPTQGLDSGMRSIYFEFLRRLKDKGVTLLVATHDIGEAESLCDFAAVMDKGKFVDIGETEKVLRNGGIREGLFPAAAAGAT